MPKVSVIIPTYNGEKYIREAIDSVLAQSYEDFEIVVVDDGSADNTKEVLDKYEAQIKYIYQENQGRSAARNRGVKESTGEYIAFLDADDLWEVDKLMLQMAYFEKNSNLGLIYSDALSVRDREVLVPSLFRERRPYAGRCFDKLLYENFIPTQTVIVKKMVFEAVGGFDESIEVSEDYDLWLKILKKYEISYIDKVLARYRLHNNNVSQDIEKMSLAHHNILLKNIHSSKLNIIFKKNIVSKFYYKVGYNFFNANNFIKAKENFQRSIICWPFQLRSFFYLFLLVLPKKIINKIRHIKRELL